jgi:hypothetical protein
MPKVIYGLVQRLSDARDIINVGVERVAVPILSHLPFDVARNQITVAGGGVNVFVSLG